MKISKFEPIHIKWRSGATKKKSIALQNLKASSIGIKMSKRARNARADINTT